MEVLAWQVSPSPRARARVFSQRHGWSRLSEGPLRVGIKGRPWHSAVPRCNKMFVPGFGDRSPERKAADTLHDFFTYIALRIVLAQLEDYNREAYDELMEFASRIPIQDGDKFCALLMRESPRHKGLAMRILEVRSAYIQKDFEWENVKKLAINRAILSNTKLMREFLSETSKFE